MPEIDLASRKCVPCSGGTPRLAGEELKKLAAQVPGWREPKSRLAGPTARAGAGYADPVTGRVAPLPPVKVRFKLLLPGTVGQYCTTTACHALELRL